jgi:hypothetical protein
MPAPPLASKYEQPPSAPRTAPPYLGYPHRVRTGQTWQAVASYYGYANAMDLIDYNFGTKDPREINWCLRVLVGCNVATVDGKNWRFTDSASPGYIYIHPDKARKHIPVTPTPVAPAGPVLPPPPVIPPPTFLLYQYFHLRHLYQGTSNLCWAFAATMMLSWRSKRNYTVEGAMAYAGAKWLDLYDSNEGLSPSDQDEFASEFAWTAESNACLTPQAWHDALRDSGPLFLIHRATRGWHAMVLCGIRAPDPLDSTGAIYYVNDPAYSGSKARTGAQFDGDLERLGESDGRLRVYHYGPRWK